MFIDPAFLKSLEIYVVLVVSVLMKMLAKDCHTKYKCYGKVNHIPKLSFQDSSIQWNAHLRGLS